MKRSLLWKIRREKDSNSYFIIINSSIIIIIDHHQHAGLMPTMPLEREAAYNNWRKTFSDLQVENF